jgi:hypothetical protein
MGNLYIARDKDGSLWIYGRKPKRDGTVFRPQLGDEAIDVYSGLFSNVKWENSPQVLEARGL